MLVELNENTVFKAFSEPIRLRIMILLSSGELCVCDLTEVLKLPQSTISRHISRLKALALVNSRRKGKWVFFSLNDKNDDFIKQLFQILKSLQTKEPYSKDIENLKIHLQKKKC